MFYSEVMFLNSKPASFEGPLQIIVRPYGISVKELSYYSFVFIAR